MVSAASMPWRFRPAMLLTGQSLGCLTAVVQIRRCGNQATVAAPGPLREQRLTRCGLKALALSPSYAVDKTIFVGGDWEGVFKSSNSGGQWLKVSSARFTRTLAISPVYSEDQTLFLGQNTGQMARSTNGGSTWMSCGRQPEPTWQP